MSECSYMKCQTLKIANRLSDIQKKKQKMFNFFIYIKKTNGGKMIHQLLSINTCAKLPQKPPNSHMGIGVLEPDNTFRTRKPKTSKQFCLG